MCPPIQMSVHASPDWSRQSQVPPLGLSEIHVWRIRLAWPDPVTSRLKKCLTAEESDRAAGFHFARHQRRFIIRRAILRQLLAAYQGGRAERVCLRPGPMSSQPRSRQRWRWLRSGGSLRSGIRFTTSVSALRQSCCRCDPRSRRRFAPLSFARPAGLKSLAFKR